MAHDSFDKSFIKRLVQGDGKAIAKWYDLSAPRLLAIGMRYAANREEAEDWLHQAMLGMLKALPAFSYNFSGSFEAWMKKIMVNTSLNQLRKSNRNKILYEDIENEVLDDFDEESQEEESMPYPEADVLVEWIQKLPVGYRTVLNLYVFESYTHKQIAVELGISENTSKSQLSKARSYLRKKAALHCLQLESKINE